MDIAQVVNGVAAGVAFVVGHMVFLRFHDAGDWRALVAHLVNSTLLLWYSIINLVVGTGWVTVPTAELVPLFRWAFGPLVLSYAARQYFTLKRVVRFDGLP